MLELAYIEAIRRRQIGLRPYPKVLHLIANLQIGGTKGQLAFQFADRSTEPSRHHVACFYSIGSAR